MKKLIMTAFVMGFLMLGTFFVELSENSQENQDFFCGGFLFPAYTVDSGNGDGGGAGGGGPAPG